MMCSRARLCIWLHTFSREKRKSESGGVIELLPIPTHIEHRGATSFPPKSRSGQPWAKISSDGTAQPPSINLSTQPILLPPIIIEEEYNEIYEDI